MALNKEFKVKDTITVGQSGLFGNTVQIGESGEYLSVNPAIDAWGPILSGGRDLSQFIGDGVDTIRTGRGEGALEDQGTIEYSIQTASDDFATTVAVSGLGYDDTPQFAGLTLSGVGLETATLYTAATFTIDPAADGASGKVIIAGDLQVDGVTTTLNSTTLEVDDKTVVLNKGALDAANGNGGGIQLDLGSGFATILYTNADDKWNLNKGLVIGGALSASGNTELDGTLAVDGATTINNTLTIVGDNKTTLGGSLQVDGTLTDLNTNLEVSGTTLLSSTLSATGVATFGSAVSAGDTLHVDGESTLASAIVEDLTNDRIVIVGSNKELEDSADFTFDGTSLNVGQGKFTADTTGNVVADGNVDINGTTSLSGDFVISTDAEVEKLKITQATGDLVTSGTLSAKGADIDGALDVDGTTTLNTLSVSGDTTFSGSSVEIDGTTTLNSTVTLSADGTSASSVDYVYVGAAVASAAAASYTETLSVTDLNAAKFIVAVDGGINGKSVIELLVARNDTTGALDGTAYGQVDVGTSQIVDIDVAAENSTVGISVTGTSGAAVTIFGTGYYN
jgi:hypothetical protein